MLRNYHSPNSRDAPAAETTVRRTAIGKMLHDLLDAFREGLGAHREYERLISAGMRHDPALRAAVSETCHSHECCARTISIRSAILVLAGGICAWIEHRRQLKTLARLDDRLLRDIGLTRSEHSETGVKPLSFLAEA
jgi:uncharacterized protein YjiS (DUF1127 family)